MSHAVLNQKRTSSLVLCPPIQRGFVLHFTCPNRFKLVLPTSTSPPTPKKKENALFLNKASSCSWFKQGSSSKFIYIYKILCADVLYIFSLFLFFFLQLRNVPNFLRHEHSILVRWFSNGTQPSIGKRDGMLIILTIWCLLSCSLLIKWTSVFYHSCSLRIYKQIMPWVLLRCF